jgi:hypothetical protein
MAVRQFALGLDLDTVQTGDITFAELKENDLPVIFDLINVVEGQDDTVNFITKKGGVTTDHEFAVTITDGTAKVELSASQIATIYDDATDGDWDYVEARWTVGATDTPITSVEHETQDDIVYDSRGWPPKPKN